ncbi:MAG: hypothetical protein PHU14_06890 [Methylovulum sp.]|nr:hypothetical protein [Methylovulum sp.]
MISDNSQPKRRKVTVQEASVLVAPAQSSKLAALRDKARGVVAAQPAPTQATCTNAALSHEVAAELHKARQLVDARCAAIMSHFPALKQNKLFTLRFGSLEALKNLPINTIAKRLDMDTQTLNLRLLAKLNYHGYPPE